MNNNSDIMTLLKGNTNESTDNKAMNALLKAKEAFNNNNSISIGSNKVITKVNRELSLEERFNLANKSNDKTTTRLYLNIESQGLDGVQFVLPLTCECNVRKVSNAPDTGKYVDTVKKQFMANELFTELSSFLNNDDEVVLDIRELLKALQYSDDLKLVLRKAKVRSSKD